MRPFSIAFVGEAMVELNRVPSQGDDLMRQSFGGDTLNAAVYCKRAFGTQQAARVHYATRIGDDLFSKDLSTVMDEEGLNTDTVCVAPNETIGLYAIELDEEGERSFSYWRDTSAAKRMFDGAAGEALIAQLKGMDALYFSGITLAVLPEGARAVLLELARAHKADGKLVAFDGNYRPRLWPNKDTARSWIERGYAASSVGLPTYEDELKLYQDKDKSTTAKRIRALGCEAVVVKDGPEPVVLCDTAHHMRMPTEPVTQVVDTTAAGDSFNGALIAARLAGENWLNAIQLAQKMAGAVISSTGALVDRKVTHDVVVPLAKDVAS